MKLEHVAFNVTAPVEAAAWYVKNLDMEMVWKRDDAPFTHFLADESGQMTLEFYNNPPDQVPNYAEMNPLLLHVAFVSNDPTRDKEKLIAAGATLVSDDNVNGLHLVMLRDPWGLPLQLCKRAMPVLRKR